MRFAFIQNHQQVWPVETLCRTLRVTRAGYYAWRLRGRHPGGGSPRQQRRAVLARQVRQAHAASRGIYGSPRVHRELAAGGVVCCENTVARRMREAGLYSRRRRRFGVRTTDARHAHPVAENLLARNFSAAGPDQKWVSDITYIPTEEGWLYLAGVLDLCTRKLVGYAMGESLEASLACAALAMALRRRRPRRNLPGAEGLLHHSDRGVQYACGEYQALLRSSGLTCSMSGSGDCYDNAAMESFWSSLKTEWVYHQHYATREEARQSLFEYMEVFYNRQRRHSSLGYLSPEAFEARFN